jgi:tetratricopeptide (TPR) repeat protein
MPRDVVQEVPMPRRISLWLRIVCKELQYRLLGLSPKHYHLYQARKYRDLHLFARAAKQYRSYLKILDSPHIRSELGMCLGTIEKWGDALAEYERAEIKWPHPAVQLALAEVHLRLGNNAASMAQIAKVDMDNPDMTTSLKDARLELIEELNSGA